MILMVLFIDSIAIIKMCDNINWYLSTNCQKVSLQDFQFFFVLTKSQMLKLWFLKSRTQSHCKNKKYCGYLVYNFLIHGP